MGKSNVEAIFLDRDGIINVPIIMGKKPLSLSSVEQFCFTEHIFEIMEHLSHVCDNIFIVTNQPEVSRGTISKEEVQKIEKVIMEKFPFVKKFYTCYHSDEDSCNCRKPKIGFLLDSCTTYGVKLENSWVIGDRWRDVELGKNAACKTIFVDYGYNETLRSNPDYKIQNLLDIKHIIN